MSSDVDLRGVAAEVDDFLARHTDELTAFRRDLHAHPELARAETRTTSALCARLERVGLVPQVLPGGTGLWCDIGGESDNDPGVTVALRADIDALPIPDEKVGAACRSTVPGVCHACGHDVHATVVLGAGLALAARASAQSLPGRVRLIFEPAEEANPGGALDVIASGALDGVSQIFALHCDPRQDVGTVGLRSGAITGSSDHVRVHLTGPGGHTARPHLTADLVYALAKVVTDVPSVLSRRVDPRVGLSVVWGHLDAGDAANVIPQRGTAEGTVRSLDADAWRRAPDLVTQAVSAVVAPYDVSVSVDYARGVPPVVNDTGSVEVMRVAASSMLGAHSVFEAEQSLGGEDFASFLERVPGALARLGVRTPDGPVHDLHTGSFDPDERAIAVGVRLLTATALLALG